MRDEYKKLCVYLKEIAEKNEHEELKRINEHFKKENKVFQSMKEAQDYSNDLMNEFRLKYPKTKKEKERAISKAKENIINEYEEVIDGITINIITIRDKEFKLPIMDKLSNMCIPEPDIIYRTWLTLTDEDHIYDNLLLEVSPNQEEAKKYFESLLDIVKNNDIDTISKKILKIVEK